MLANIMIEDLKQDFELLRDHCIYIRQSYNTYTDLFNEENEKLLSCVAATFFTDIAKILQRDWMLQVCKLGDPAETTRKKEKFQNITIALIDKKLKECDLLNNEIQKHSLGIFDYCNKVKPARHKRIAHFDREHQLNGKVLGETTEDELQKFLCDIQQYCDEVGTVIGLGPLDFTGSGCEGDVLDLLKVLRGKA